MTLKIAIYPRLLSSCRADRRSYRVAAVEIASFTLAGVVLAAVNAVVYKLPLLDSGGTVLIGCVFFGILSAIDHGMLEDYRWILGPGDMKTPEPPVDISRRLMILGGLLTLITLAVVLMAIYQDYLLIDARGEGDDSFVAQVITDVVVGALVVSAFGVRVLYSVTRNMGELLRQQVAAVNRVKEGDLDTHVPVKSPDEFGLVSTRLNKMIEAMRERERIKSTLGKVVSPEIADKLMATDTSVLRAGQRVKVAILFSDIRSFTTITEQSNTEGLLNMLNQHFQRASEIIYRRHGFIDKFIGDAVLAVFGLNDNEGAAENALRAAQEMVAHDPNLKTPQGAPMKMGIGLHYGEVASGLIGSDSRFEYTVIGDSVNTAARLESMSKILKRKVVLSRKIFERLPPECQELVEDLGEHQVRGRDKSVFLYGYGEL